MPCKRGICKISVSQAGRNEVGLNQVNSDEDLAGSDQAEGLRLVCLVTCLTILPASLRAFADSNGRGASLWVASIRPSSTASRARQERSRTIRRYFWSIGRSAG